MARLRRRAAASGLGPTDGQDAGRLRIRSGQLRRGGPRCRVDDIELGKRCRFDVVSAMRACCECGVSLTPALHIRNRITARCFPLHRYHICRISELLERAGRRLQRAWSHGGQAAQWRAPGPVVAVHASVVFVSMPRAALPA